MAKSLITHPEIIAKPKAWAATHTKTTSWLNFMSQVLPQAKSQSK